jgi:hypothetical protein
MTSPNAETPATRLLTNSFPNPKIPKVPMDTQTGLDGKPWPSQFVSSPVGPKLTVGHDLHEVPGGKRRLLYFRYQVWKGHKVIHSEHIPGGNISKDTAKRRAAIIRKAIAAGESPDKILRQIREWKRTDRKAREQQLSLL